MFSLRIAFTTASSRFWFSLCAGLFFYTLSVGPVHAVDSFQPATNVIGQDDGTVSAPQPIFTKGAANNGPNKLGLNATVMGMALDTTDHRLFLSDTTNNRVLVYGLTAGNLLADRIPDNVLGQANFWSGTAANTQSGMNTPNGIAFDDTNNRLFVAQGLAATSARVTVYDVTSITDGENAVNVLGQNSFTVSVAASTQEGLRLPMGVAYDSVHNRLFVAQNTGNRVTVFDTAVIADGEAATNVLGQADFTTITAATTQAGMNVPYDVSYDSTHDRLFVSEGTGNRVTVYNTASISDGENAVSVLGQTNFTNTAAATTQAGMNAPRGLSYDDANQILYVTQLTGNRVTTYDVTSITNGENAVHVLGQSLFTAATAATTQSGMNGPTGAMLDEVNHLLYVQQSTANRVSIFDVASITDGENAVDLLGQTDDFITAPGPIYTNPGLNNGPYKMGLSAPAGIALDKEGHRFFVTDTANNRILVYNLSSGNLIEDNVPDNILGQSNYYTNTLATTQSGLNAPNDLLFDPATDRLFVSDSTNNRVMIFDVTSITDGENAVNVLGQVNYTTLTSASTQIGFFAPKQLAYDSVSGMLYVADSANHRVKVYDVTTVVDGETAVNVIGQDDGTVSAPQPIFTKTAANNGPHKLGMSAPTNGIAMDRVDHRLFISDTSNNRVLEYDLDSSNVLLDRTPDNVLGQLNFYSSTAANTRGGMSAPQGLTYDSANKRLFVVQSNRVTTYDVTTITDGEDAVNVLGQTVFTAATAASTQVGLNIPVGVTYDSTGQRLFVAQNTGNRVSVFSFGGIVDYPNADNALGQYDDSLSAPAPVYTKTTAHNGPDKLGLSGPAIGTALDPTDHRFFLSDTVNNRVLVYNLDSSNLLIDNIPDNVLGQMNYYSNAAATTQIGLNSPCGLTYDDTNNRLFVAGNANRVTVYDVSSITDGENAINVLGQTTFITATAATTQSGMNVPQGIDYDDTNHRLFVAQSTANRVTVYDVTTITNGENAVSVLGQPDFVTATAATTQGGMNAPYDVIYDSAHQRLFVSQGTANRVTVYDTTTITDGENAVNVLGQANFVTATAATTQSGMNAPRGLSYDDGSQILYVVQMTANRVTTYDVTSITDGENAVNVLGQTLFTIATAATTQTGLNGPTGAMLDEANHLLYVQQSTANRISIFDTASITDGENAVGLLGQYDDSTSAPAPVYTKSEANNGPNQFGLSAPIIGLALDPTGHRLFVSDTGNNRILEYDLDANDLLVDRLPDHVLGQVDFHSNAAAKTQSTMSAPNGLTYDDVNSRLFVADTSNNRVLAFDVTAITDGQNASSVLGQGTAGAVGTFTNTMPVTTQGGLNVPTGVVYDTTGQRLYVAQNTGNRVTVFDVATVTDGEDAINVLGQTNFTTATAATTQAGMNIPYDLALSGSTLFVSQGTANRVTTYDVASITDGENATNVLGQSLFTVATLGNTQAGMNAPRGLAYDAVNKKLYVAQLTGNRVTVYNLADGITDGENAVNVIGQAVFTVITALVDQQGLSGPTGVLADPAHDRVYVMQATSNRILSYNTQVGIANGLPASGVLGQPDFTTVTAATTQAGMNKPYDVVLSGSTLFVAQGTANRVTTYDVATVTNGENAMNVLGQADFVTATAATTQAGMNLPTALAYDSTNKKLYVSQATGNRVTVYNTGDGITNGESAVSVLGQPNFITTTAATRQAGLNAPSALLIDPPNDTLYVSQSTANRVSLFNVAAITNGEDAVDLIGQSGDDLNPPAPVYTKGTLNNGPYKLGLSAPSGVAIDSTNHRLFIADSTNNRVLEYDLDSGNILLDNIPDHVLGQQNYYSNALATTQSGLNVPISLSYDANDNVLYVADTTNNRILIFDTASITDGENASTVLGQPNFTTLTAGTTQFGLSGPRQISYESTSGQLFVADTGNNRMLTYQIHAAATSSGGGDEFHFFGF